jgi:hypothetical protein
MGISTTVGSDAGVVVEFVVRLKSSVIDTEGLLFVAVDPIVESDNAAIPWP